VVLGCDDLVSVVALAGQVGVGQLQVLVYCSLHAGVVASNSTSLHCY
jgi:hypothetical protein